MLCSLFHPKHLRTVELADRFREGLVAVLGTSVFDAIWALWRMSEEQASEKCIYGRDGPTSKLGRLVLPLLFTMHVVLLSGQLRAILRVLKGMRGPRPSLEDADELDEADLLPPRDGEEAVMLRQREG